MAKVVSQSPFRRHIAIKNTLDAPFKSNWPKLSEAVIKEISEEVKRALCDITVKSPRKKKKKFGKHLVNAELETSEALVKRQCLDKDIDSSQSDENDFNKEEQLNPSCEHHVIDAGISHLGAECVEDTGEIEAEKAPVADVNVHDAASADVNVQDAASADVNVQDAASADVNVRDAASADVNVQDAASADVNVQDASNLDVKVESTEPQNREGSDSSVREVTNTNYSNIASEKLSGREDYDSVDKRKDCLVLGINAVTRLLEHGRLAAGLVCSSSPSLLYQHLLPLAAMGEVPFAAVPDLSVIISQCLGIKRAVCLGIKKSCGERNPFLPLYDKIIELVNPLSLPWIKLPPSKGDPKDSSSLEPLPEQAKDPDLAIDFKDCLYYPLQIKKLKTQPKKSKKRK